MNCAKTYEFRKDEPNSPAVAICTLMGTDHKVHDDEVMDFKWNDEGPVE